MEVWFGPDQPVERKPVAAGARSPEHLLSQVDFSVPDDLRALEYRLYVNEGVEVTLERVELYSGLAIPPDNP